MAPGSLPACRRGARRQGRHHRTAARASRTRGAKRTRSLAGTVEVVEALGADTLLHLDVGGRNVISRVPHGRMPSVGSTLPLRADPERVYLFDAESGARLR